MTINRAVDTDARKGIVTRGRQLLWLVYDYHRVSEEAGALYDISDLLQIEWLSDAKIETFISNWENVLSGCIKEVEEDVKRALFLKQVRKSQNISQDLAHYDRLPEGHEEKTYTFLRRACQRQITLARLEGNRAAHARASQLGASTPALHSTNGQRQGKGEKGKGNNKHKTTRKRFVATEFQPTIRLRL